MAFLEWKIGNFWFSGDEKRVQEKMSKGTNMKETITLTKGRDRINNTNQQTRTKRSKIRKDQNNESLVSLT